MSAASTAQEFEVKLRNELTLKAISRECADWVRRKVTFKSNTTQEQMPGFITVGESTYMPINGFTTVDLGCERGNNVYNSSPAPRHPKTAGNIFACLTNCGAMIPACRL